MEIGLPHLADPRFCRRCREKNARIEALEASALQQESQKSQLAAEYRSTLAKLAASEKQKAAALAGSRGARHSCSARPPIRVRCARRARVSPRSLLHASDIMPRACCSQGSSQNRVRRALFMA